MMTIIAENLVNYLVITDGRPSELSQFLLNNAH
jgi:hypothetical protein